MGDFDDMNATPLGKLSMPAVQSKGDAPRVDLNSTSYSDILKEMNKKAPEPAGSVQKMAQQMSGVQQPVPQTPMMQFPQAHDMNSDMLMGGGGGGGGMNAAAVYQYPSMPGPSMPGPSMPGGYYPQQHVTAPRQRRPRYEDDDEPPPPRPATRSTTMMRGGGWMSKAREYKTSILVTLVVFVVLMYVAPKMGSMVPQLLTPAGKFNALGLFAIATMSGGIHRLLDHYVK